MKSYNRTENTDKFSDIAKRFGESDIRFGQAVINTIKRNKLSDQSVDSFLYNIENDLFEEMLLEELESYNG